jgi:eukaryotic-like serine/threonine-protein kinase
MEVNPPQCRLIDMGSHNGTYVNGKQVLAADLKDGDQIRAGHTILRVQVQSTAASPHEPPTISFPPQAAGPATTLPPIPGYVLERELGRGAMGATYLGRRVDDPTMYAVKVVRPSFQGSPTQIDDFLRSARCLAKLDHPHIVRLHEVGGCPSGFFFASEFLPGLSAAQIVERDGPLTIKRAVRWADQMLRALQYAHGKHFIHRHIKPSNVIVAQIEGKEVVKLADFGVARVWQAAPFSGLSLTDAMLNLASFIPPEVLFNFQEINPLADQYSLAAVIYHCLTGAPVLDFPKEERKRYTSLLRRQHLPLRERRGDVPAPLADVIEKALARTPSQRYAGVAEFRQALVRAAQGDSGR